MSSSKLNGAATTATPAVELATQVAGLNVPPPAATATNATKPTPMTTLVTPTSINKKSTRSDQIVANLTCGRHLETTQSDRQSDAAAAQVISANALELTGDGAIGGPRQAAAASAKLVADNNNDSTFQVQVSAKAKGQQQQQQPAEWESSESSSVATAAAKQASGGQGECAGDQLQALSQPQPESGQQKQPAMLEASGEMGEERAAARPDDSSKLSAAQVAFSSSPNGSTSASNRTTSASSDTKLQAADAASGKRETRTQDNLSSPSEGSHSKRVEADTSTSTTTTIELGPAQHSIDLVANKIQLNGSNVFNSNRPPLATIDANQKSAKNLESEQEHQHQHQESLEFLYTSKRVAPKRLGYFQSLLLRKWPCLALTICIMSSLVFGMLLSALTIYLMHDVADCGQLALAAARSNNHHHLHHHHEHPAQRHSVNLLPHELMIARPPNEFGLLESSAPAAAADEPLELAGRHATVAEGAPAARDSNETAAHAAMGAPGKPTSASFQRLPASLAPEHYNLFIWPHIAEPSFHFNGSLEIHLKCLAPTDNVTLHTLELELNERSIELLEMPAEGASEVRRTRRAPSMENQASRKVVRVSQDKQLQYSIIHLSEPLVAGRQYLLRLDFVGTLNDDLAGFYKIKYERQNSTETTWIAATQFQATDARRAFPCFDEPHYKATFSIKIRHWNNMTALSNMPIVKSEKSSDGLWITDTFAKSHRMSTYLVAWTVTNFESRSDGNISVWTRPGFAHTAEYALKIAGKILRHYENFFGIEYPLPKMDMIALPDFNAGAMENWGLITYRETAMLYDESSSSVANKQRVAVVVAHELAHQWFGNLVTPKWWDDLWLNEGFASFVEYIGVDHVEPKWRMLEQFVVEEVQNVFKVDGLSSSHQISIPVNNPDEISEIFDHISYAKGASIIRMMSHFLTEDVFKLGLQRYLHALKYSNAEQSDLWAHLTGAQESLKSANPPTPSAQSVDVERVMNSWTLQTGYPLVTLTRDYEQPNQVVGRLQQVRYQPYKLMSKVSSSSSSSSSLLRNNTEKEAAASEQRWEIPITFTWKSDQNWQPATRLWMHQNETRPVDLERALADVKADEWILMNVQQVGYYRVNYDQRNWHLLIKQLQQDHTKILATNRAQLLDDIFELAKSSLIDYRLAMEATKYLKAERDYLPWDSVLLSFGYIDEMLQRTPIYGAWQDYFAQLIEPYYSRYKNLDWTQPAQPLGNRFKLSTGSGQLVLRNQSQQQPAGNGTQQQQQQQQAIDSNDVLELYNQVNAVSWACQVNNQHCIGRAKEVFAEWRATGQNNIKPALRYAAYCTAIEFGNKDDWDFLWRVYEREQAATERDRILRALGCSKEIWVLSRYLDWTFNKTKPIRRQDGSFVFRVIAKNNYGRDIAFNFMRERWATIKEYYGKTSFSLGHLIKSIATLMNTQVELDQLKGFYESIKGDVGTGKRSFQIAIEEVESNVYWRDRNYKILENWLQSQQPAVQQA